MQIILKTLEIKNFKGIRHLKVDFHPRETSIYGENGTGKTSIADAFYWLLFEKDTKGKSAQTFEIKTKENGQVIHGLDHEVIGIFEVDGVDLTLRKIYRENWVKKRGVKNPVFSGHDIDRFINEVPSNKTDYMKKIDELIDERIFPMITDPLYFSSVLKWNERRNILFEMMNGEFSEDEIFSEKIELEELRKELSGKSIEELQKQYTYQKKELSKKLQDVPVRIDTLQSTIKEIDMDALHFQIRSKKANMEKIEEILIDVGNRNEERLKKQEQIYKNKSRLKEIEAIEREQVQDPNVKIFAEMDRISREKNILSNELLRIQNQKEQLEKQIRDSEDILQNLRHDFHQTNDEKIDYLQIETSCPTCKRAFDDYLIDEKREELSKQFHENKIKMLEKIREKGKKESERKEKIQNELTELSKTEEEQKNKIDSLEEQNQMLNQKLTNDDVETAEDRLLKNTEYQNLMTEISQLESTLKDENWETEIREMKEKKKQIEESISILEKEIHQDEINRETKEKIQHLMEEEKKLSASISNIERLQELTEQYIRIRAELIEKNINSKFENVEFKLFDTQINGGIAETCEVLVKGISFNDGANTAGRINAGLDIINSLCRHYGVNAPIWIDNRESTNQIIPVDSQIINLIVSHDKELRIQ